MSEELELSRDELYEAVWAEPIAIAAADFRIGRFSSVTFKKAAP
jgi:hypothetical protein